MKAHMRDEHNLWSLSSGEEVLIMMCHDLLQNKKLFLQYVVVSFVHEDCQGFWFWNQTFCTRELFRHLINWLYNCLCIVGFCFITISFSFNFTSFFIFYSLSILSSIDSILLVTFLMSNLERGFCLSGVNGWEAEEKKSAWGQGDPDLLKKVTGEIIFVRRGPVWIFPKFSNILQIIKQYWQPYHYLSF